MQDGISVSSSGMGSPCDNTTSMQPGRVFPASFYNNYNTPLGLFGLHVDQYWRDMYRSYWEAKKIVTIPADDSTREGWEWKSEKTNPDDLEELKKKEKAIGLRKEVYRARIYERLYGGGLVFLGMKKNENDPTTAADPLNPEDIEEGDLAFVRAIPSFQVSSTNISTNPLDPEYNRPSTFVVNGIEVHRSRFLIFDGTPLDEPFYGASNAFSRNYRLGFGESVLQCLFTEIQDAQGSRQSVSHLLHKLSVAIFKKRGTNALRTSNQGNVILEGLEDIVQMMSNYRGVILDPEDSIENYTSNANTGEGLIITFLQVLSAASDIPATRFLGQAPGGLNATGESDLRNYYDRIKADQINNMEMDLNRAGDIMARSFLGKEIDDLHVEFSPLWQPTEKEKAEIRQMDATTITTLVGGPIMLEEDGQKEALERNVVLNELEKFEPEDDTFDLNLPPVPGEEGEEVDTGEEDADIRSEPQQ